jgi:NAD(P)-dependent dehydrogenase (short-subunit alcohol dehydrogenase family)
VDVDAGLPTEKLARRLVQEVSEDDLLEVGHDQHGRWQLALRREAAEPARPLDINAQSVILVTGGAYGVTADVARALAVSCRPRLILVGRSALPGEEPETTRGLEGQALRQRLIESARANGKPPLPADIEKSLARIVRERHIRANLAACQAAGSAVEYHALDVRDALRFGELIDSIYSRHGRLDGVVHGAGVIEDKLIRDKTPESFANVFRTKVAGAVTLAEKLRPEGLQFLALFSSVSARFGNRGQADYSAANEFLNKLACQLGRLWPGRVVSLNWGPWDGGMVSDELRRLYAQTGYKLIPVAEGAEAFLAELQDARRAPEVVLACDVDKMIETAQKR